MTGAQLLSLCRLAVPEADSGVISDANAYIILNIGAQKFVSIAKALPMSTLFDSTDDTGEYSIATNVTRYQSMRPEGLWWYNLTNTSWVRLKPKTTRVLDQKYPQWRSGAAGSPKHYALEGDTITVYPKVETGGTDHFRLYHFGISVDMAAATYPFGGATHYPFLADYEEDLIDWYKYRVKQIMGYADQAEEAKNMFIRKAEYAGSKLKNRPDIAQDAHVQPRSYRSGFGGSRRQSI